MADKIKRLLKADFVNLYKTAHPEASKEQVQEHWVYFKKNCIPDKEPHRSVKCCKWARPQYCVCVHSSYCPVHGDHHVGSHE